MSTLTRRLRSVPLGCALLLLAPWLGATASPRAEAGGVGDGRVETGVRLFRAMLAADTEIERKVDGEGALRLLIVHAGDASRAKGVMALLARRDAPQPPEPIKGLPVRLEVVRVEDLAASARKPVAGVFLAESLSRAGLATLIQFGVERRLVVYSPFEGDVEQGVSGGLSIEAQVRPLVNASSLRAAQVTLKEFFLKVAKVFP